MSGSQINFPLTGSWNVLAPFCSSPETGGYRKLNTASPSFTAWALVNNIRFSKNNIPIDVGNMGLNKLYGKNTAFREYTVTTAIHPYAITLLKYGTEDPDYTTPSGTSAESLSFLLKYLQALGSSTMDTYYLFFLGMKINTLEMMVQSRDLVTATADWMLGEIMVPTNAANGGLVTPTIPQNSDITSQPWSNVEAPYKNLKIGSNYYANKNFRHRWNNNLIPDDYIGSGLLDALTVGNRRFEGSFITPRGQDLAIDAKEHDAPQTSQTALYDFKTSVAVLQISGFYIRGSNPVLSTDNNETWHDEFTFETLNTKLGTFAF